jgi:phosphatidylinositol alpha-1,6-mannosyltransferase
LQRWLLKKHTCNIVNAKRTGKILKKIGVKSEILLIYPCVENLPALNKVIERKKLIQIYSIKESDLIIGFLGRHVQRKGMRNLILAVQDLRRSGYEISLLIAGQGPESDNIQNFIRENDCQAFCMMIGLLPEEEKASFLCGIDVFSMPNISDPKTGDSEGFGIVFLEAAQQGTAVIGGKDGGVPEAISDEFNGLIVDGQSYTSIKMAIKKYYQNPSLRLAHGENGKLWAKKFDWQDQVKPLVQFLVKN